MKTKNQLSILLLTMITFFSPSLITKAQAQNLQFVNITAGGLGCPSDTTQIATAPDLSAVSLIFQGFETHVPTAPNPKASPYIMNLNCNIFLDMKIPLGQRIDSIEISYDMRGMAALDQGVSGLFRSFLISSSGLGTERNGSNILLQEKTWFNTASDQQEDFTISTTKSIALSSQCNTGLRGADKVSIHLQHILGSQIETSSQHTSAEGTITMDTSDMKGGIKFRANTSPCQMPGPGPRPGPGPVQPPRNPEPGRNCHVIRGPDGRSQVICQ